MLNFGIKVIGDAQDIEYAYIRFSYEEADFLIIGSVQQIKSMELLWNGANRIAGVSPESHRNLLLNKRHIHFELSSTLQGALTTVFSTEFWVGSLIPMKSRNA